MVRGGVGQYSAEFPAIVFNESRSVFPDFLSLNIAQPALARPERVFGSLDSGLARAGRLGTVNLDPKIPNLIALLASYSDTDLPRATVAQTLPIDRLANPYALHYSGAVDFLLGSDHMLTVSYVGTQGRKLLRLTTPEDGPLPSRAGAITVKKPTAGNTEPGIPVFGRIPVFGVTEGVLSEEEAPASRFVDFRPLIFESTGSSRYHSLQTEFRRRYSSLAGGDLQYAAAFTWAKAFDDASDFFDTLGSFVLPANSAAPSERGPSAYDTRLRFAAHFVWDLPWLKNRRWVGGWQLNGIYAAQTGQPYTVNTAFDLNRDGNLTDRLFTADGLRSDPDPRQILSLGDAAPEAFLAPLSGEIFQTLVVPRVEGTVGRNTFRAPGMNNLDLALSKGFRFSERLDLRFRAEVYNAFNRNHFGIPVRILEAPSFGRAVNTAVEPRAFQFAVKAVF